MKRLLMALVFAASVSSIVLLTPTDAQALPCCDSYKVYYSDCNYSQEVGVFERACNGQVIQNWGNQSGSIYYYQSTWCDNGDCCSPEFPDQCICEGGGYWGC
jgi:hypothetical protein